LVGVGAPERHADDDDAFPEVAFDESTVLTAVVTEGTAVALARFDVTIPGLVAPGIILRFISPAVERQILLRPGVTGGDAVVVVGPSIGVPACGVGSNGHV